MNEKSPLDWARLAAEAATIKASELTVIKNSIERDLPAFYIGDTAVYQVRVRGTRAWRVGINTCRTLAEALAEAVSQEAYNRVEAALGQAGLAT